MITNLYNSNNIRLRDFVNEYLGLIKDKQISVFTGAGISLGSGLPLASELINYVLLNISETNSMILDKPLSYLPFEGYIEQMIKDSNDETIMQMFTDESLCPNENHRLIARLHKCGAIKRIYTVNFDILHEKAFNEINIKSNKIYRDEDFTSKSYSDSSINLIKLHGCGSDSESMKFVLSSVTNRKNRIQREYLTKLLFGNPNEIIVIWGYSASDNFDIIPAINSIKENKATVIYVSHKNKAGHSLEIIRNEVKSDDYVFSSFPGFHISADTTNLIRLWSRLYRIKRDIIPNKTTSEYWKSFIQPFIKSLKDIRYKFLGTVCNQAGLLQDAKIFFENDVELKPRGYSFQQLAQLSLIFGNDDDYVMYINKALLLTKEDDDFYTYISCLLNKAEYVQKSNNIRASLDYYVEAYVLSTIYGFIPHIVSSLKGIGKSYAELSDFERANEYCDLLILLTSSDNSLRERTDAIINKAEVLRKIGKICDALDLIDEAIVLKEKLGDKITYINALLVRANIWKDLKRYSNAIRDYKEAIKNAKEYNDTEVISRIYHQLGVTQFLKGDSELECIENIYLAYIDFFRLGNKQYCISCVNILCNICTKLMCKVIARIHPTKVESFKWLQMSEIEQDKTLQVRFQDIYSWTRHMLDNNIDDTLLFQLLYEGRTMLVRLFSALKSLLNQIDDNGVLYQRTIKEWQNIGILNADKSSE